MVKPAKKTGSPKGHVRLVVQVRPEQLEALVAEAERRRRPGSLRADASAVVRDALDAFLGKRTTRRA